MMPVSSNLLHRATLISILFFLNMPMKKQTKQIGNWQTSKKCVTSEMQYFENKKRKTGNALVTTLVLFELDR
jgi:hypothetical protein